jgi:hypothetical protein
LKKKTTNKFFRKRLILDGKVSGFGNRYDTLEQLLKEAKQLGHMNERKYEEVDNEKLLILFVFTNIALFFNIFASERDLSSLV